MTEHGQVSFQSETECTSLVDHSSMGSSSFSGQINLGHIHTTILPSSLIYKTSSVKFTKPVVVVVVVLCMYFFMTHV